MVRSVAELSTMPPLQHYSLSPAELLFLEASAMTGENVEEAFLKCAKCILAKIETGVYLGIWLLQYLS